MKNITLAILFALSFVMISETQAQEQSGKKEPAVGREAPWTTLQGLYGNPTSHPQDSSLYQKRHAGEE